MKRNSLMVGVMSIGLLLSGCMNPQGQPDSLAPQFTIHTSRECVEIMVSSDFMKQATSIDLHFALLN